MKALHQSQLPPAENKFHVGNGADGKHYWLSPAWYWARLKALYGITREHDMAPFPKPDGFNGLRVKWPKKAFINPPFGSIIDEDGRKKGPTAWAKKAIAEHEDGAEVVMIYPIDKWVLRMIAAGAIIRNLGDVRFLATEDGSEGKGTGRHIAEFALLSLDKRIAWLEEQLAALRALQEHGPTPAPSSGGATNAE